MAQPKAYVNENGEKRCTGCKQWLPLGDFHKHSDSSSGTKARCKRCGCAQALGYYYKHPEKSVESQRRYRSRHRVAVNKRRMEYRHKNPERAILYFARRRARLNSLPFDIELSDVIIPEFCPILGIRLVAGGSRRQKDCSPTIDKVIPSLGYVKGNIQVISWRANRIKSDATIDELRSIVKYMATYSERDQSRKATA